MNRPLSFALLVLLLDLGLGSAAGAETPAEIEKKILEAANDYRAKNDVGKLVIDNRLNRIAQLHAKALAKADKFGDDDRNAHVLDGKGPLDRVKAGKYEFARITENVAYNIGSRDPAEDAMKGWIASPGHQKNLVDKLVTQTGIGAAKGASGRWYFVQMFGRPLRRQTLVEVQIENQTEKPIRFRIGANSHALKPGGKGSYVYRQAAGKVKIRITWPGASKEEIADLEDVTSYAFRYKKEYSFEKIESP
jgi:hypothetical protein